MTTAASGVVRRMASKLASKRLQDPERQQRCQAQKRRATCASTARGVFSREALARSALYCRTQGVRRRGHGDAQECCHRDGTCVDRGASDAAIRSCHRGSCELLEGIGRQGPAHARTDVGIGVGSRTSPTAGSCRVAGWYSGASAWKPT